MPRFNANLSQLYTELEFLDRFAAAAADGFCGVEYRGPYDFEPSIISQCLLDNNLTQVLFNLPAGDWAAGERGIACLPGRQQEFRNGLEQAIDYAQALGCKRLNCLAGLMPSGVEYAELEATLLDNLTYAVKRIDGCGISLLLEPLNRHDLPNCMLVGTANAERIIKNVGSENLRLQFDFYHTQITEGDILRRFVLLLPIIEHVQIAGNPGRHEPDVGEINYEYIFEQIDQLKYEGWVGCEYFPKGRTSDGLAWFHRTRDEPGSG